LREIICLFGYIRETEKRSENSYDCVEGCFDYIDKCFPECPIGTEEKQKESEDEKIDYICVYSECFNNDINNCGDNCVLDINGYCRRSCSDKVYSENIEGICILKKCNDRIYNESLIDGCGKDCFIYKSKENTNTYECTEKCGKNYYSDEGTNTNLCKEKKCEDRINDGDEIKPCGSGECYWDEEYEEKGSCIKNENIEKTECSNEAHYYFSVEKMMCLEKECNEREINESSYNGLCGKGECYFDSENNKCVSNCKKLKSFIYIFNYIIC
jgi:hypothetical protein